MNTRKFFASFIMLGLATGVYAQAGRYRVAKEIYDNPSILTEPGFWIAVVVCLVLVGIYAIVKDKGK